MANDTNPPPRPKRNPLPGAVPNTAPQPSSSPSQVDAAKIAQIERELDQARQQIAESTAKIERALGKG